VILAVLPRVLPVAFAADPASASRKQQPASHFSWWPLVACFFNKYFACKLINN